MKNFRQRTLGFILMGIGIALMAVGVYEIVRPDEFRSKARVILQSYDCSYLVENASQHLEYHPDLTQAEIKTILSDAILSNVVNRLELREKWAIKYFNEDRISAAQAVGRMRGRLKVVQVPNAKLADIHFESGDPDEAELVANTVAEAYQGWRIEKASRLVKQEREALHEQLEITDQQISKLKDDIDRLPKIPYEELESVSSKTNYQTILKMRKNLEELNALQGLLTRKKNIGGMDPRIPFDLIFERAVPSKTPVSYHWRRGRTLTVLGIALFVWGLASIWKTRPLPRHDSPV